MLRSALPRAPTAGLSRQTTRPLALLRPRASLLSPRVLPTGRQALPALASLLAKRQSASTPPPPAGSSPVAAEVAAAAVEVVAPYTTRPGTEPMAPAPVTWVDSMPKGVQPYLYLARVDKPIGTWLLLWPCTWSIILASTVNEMPLSTPLWYTALFGVGAFVMRGAGCTINDMWDQKFDRAVERTKMRPLAAGDVNNTQASAFLGLQLSAGLAVLTQLNLYSVALGASSLALVGIYPAMKRITYWPQSVLGLAFNWGALLGWSAVAGAVDWHIALPLYAGGAIWTVMYDTIYAHQDKSDDIHAGVKSTALLFGDKTLPILSVFSASFVGLLASTGVAASCSAPFFVLSVGGAAAHLTWQLRNVDFDSRQSCWRVFRSNKWLGALIAAGFGADYWYRVGGGKQLLGLEEEEAAAAAADVAAPAQGRKLIAAA